MIQILEVRFVCSLLPWLGCLACRSRRPSAACPGSARCPCPAGWRAARGPPSLDNNPVGYHNIKYSQFLNSVTIYGNDCTAEGCQYGEEDAEVPQLVCEESGEGRREDEEDGDDGVDHRGLLHADAQVLKRRGEKDMSPYPMIT